jgi:hypothetical protein
MAANPLKRRCPPSALRQGEVAHATMFMSNQFVEKQFRA